MRNGLTADLLPLLLIALPLLTLTPKSSIIRINYFLLINKLLQIVQRTCWAYARSFSNKNAKFSMLLAVSLNGYSVLGDRKRQLLKTIPFLSPCKLRDGTFWKR